MGPVVRDIGIEHAYHSKNFSFINVKTPFQGRREGHPKLSLTQRIVDSIVCSVTLE